MTVNKKDPDLEKAIALMNESLIGPEELLIDDFKSPELPILFVIGAQRSGTTVLTQSLAGLYNISYPSNLIARFWRAPYLGALLSQSLKVNAEKMLFNSKFGATDGISGPHEFSYFWRHWFPGSAINAAECIISKKKQTILNKHFAAWQSVNNEPLLFKNLLEVIPNIQNLSSIFPTAVFLNIIRDDFFVIQSTYESRKNYSGNYESWFGIKPKNYKKIMQIDDPLIQTTEQVFYLKKDIDESLSKIPENRYININYEDLIADPEKNISRIESKCRISNWRRPDRNCDDLSLKLGNEVRLKSDQIQLIENHLQHLKKSL